MQYKTLQGYYSGHITEGCYHCIEAENELYFFFTPDRPLNSIA